MVDDSSPPRLSCTAFADALYFCYSPVHQLQTLYRSGELDDCAARWRVLSKCLALRAKPDPVAEAALTAAAQPCLWALRSPDEAATFWRAEFPH